MPTSVTLGARRKQGLLQERHRQPFGAFLCVPNWTAAQAGKQGQKTCLKINSENPEPPQICHLCCSSRDRAAREAADAICREYGTSPGVRHPSEEAAGPQQLES